VRDPENGKTCAYSARYHGLDRCHRSGIESRERVALDPTDFGGKPEERELAVRLHRTKEDIPKNGIIIDATAPLARVVDEIVRLIRAFNDPQMW
jgi:hypothetical protein